MSVNEITVSAEHEGARMVAEARAEAQRLRDEVDDYVDTALANFEQFLTRALASIERGRDKMHALREIGTFVAERASARCRSEPVGRDSTPEQRRRDRPRSTRDHVARSIATSIMANCRSRAARGSGVEGRWVGDSTVDGRLG